MGYDVAEEIRVVRNGQGVPATQPIPPDAQGHVPGLDIRPPYDPAAARALLDKFGYRDRDGDGWRERPDGQPLLLHIGTTPGPNVNASSGRTVCASLNEPKDASLVYELRLGAVFTCAQSRLCTADVEDAPNFLQ